MGEYLLKGGRASEHLRSSQRIARPTIANPAKETTQSKKIRGEPTELPRQPNAGLGQDNDGGGSPAQSLLPRGGNRTVFWPEGVRTAHPQRADMIDQNSNRVARKGLEVKVNHQHIGDPAPRRGCERGGGAAHNIVLGGRGLWNQEKPHLFYIISFPFPLCALRVPRSGTSMNNAFDLRKANPAVCGGVSARKAVAIHFSPLPLFSCHSKTQEFLIK